MRKAINGFVSIGRLVGQLGPEGIVEVCARSLLVIFGIAGILIFYLTYLPTDRAKEIAGFNAREVFVFVMALVLVAHLTISIIELIKTLRGRGIIGNNPIAGVGRARG